MKNQVSRDLAQRSFESLGNSLRQTPALSAVAAKFTKQHTEAATRRRRVVLLDMNDERDVEFWQILLNSPERYHVISQKESHQRGEYVIRIFFDELGEDLPVTKTKEELIQEHIDCIQ